MKNLENAQSGSVTAGFVTFRTKENQPCFEILEYYQNAEEAAEDISQHGWEEYAEDMIKICWLIKDDSSGRILAVGIYITSGVSSMPELMWVFTETGETERRFYEKEYAEYL
ncbi:MAG: hypothetical protein GY755_21955 [Chloroflexi bacterium]|nr:hypothetical protein [Chloroflexota bacterium]